MYENVEIYHLFHADVHRAVTNCKIESSVKDFVFSVSHSHLDNIAILSTLKN